MKTKYHDYPFLATATRNASCSVDSTYKFFSRNSNIIV